jgi:hypothetical protein
MSQPNKWRDEMKKLVLACAMLVASATAGVAGDNDCAEVLRAAKGHVRATPNGKILGRLHRYDTVSVVEVKGNWTRVIVHFSDVEGWMSTSDLQETPCQ